jgi:hypothetical protein
MANEMVFKVRLQGIARQRLRFNRTHYFAVWRLLDQRIDAVTIARRRALEPQRGGRLRYAPKVEVRAESVPA